MAATWNRNVYDVGPHLHVTITGKNPAGRKDTADDVTTFPTDRAGTGAKINYHAQTGVTFTGISMKDGGAIPAELDVLVTKKLLRLTIRKNAPDRTEWSYYVDGVGKSTQDPRIHNHL